MSKNEMTSKIRELKELKAMADELIAEITAIEDSIKADMTAQGVEDMTVDVYQVRYKTIKSSRFDTTAFRLPCKQILRFSINILVISKSAKSHLFKRF